MLQVNTGDFKTGFIKKKKKRQIAENSDGVASEPQTALGQFLSLFRRVFLRVLSQNVPEDYFMREKGAWKDWLRTELLRDGVIYTDFTP